MDDKLGTDDIGVCNETLLRYGLDGHTIFKNTRQLLLAVDNSLGCVYVRRNPEEFPFLYPSSMKSRGSVKIDMIRTHPDDGEDAYDLPIRGSLDRVDNRLSLTWKNSKNGYTATAKVI